MHEMLGNQYFLARNYRKAAEKLELALSDETDNLDIQRKLIICYTQIEKGDAALLMLSRLLEKNYAFVVNTDPVEDDCPCPELVEEMEAQLRAEAEDAEKLAVLGTLWLYCDAGKALAYFQRSVQREANNPIVNKIVTTIKTHEKNNNHQILPTSGGSL